MAATSRLISDYCTLSSAATSPRSEIELAPFQLIEIG